MLTNGEETQNATAKAADAFIMASATRLDLGATRSARTPSATFCRKGDYWVVGFEDEYSLVQDRKGLRHVAHLLCYPHKEIHVLELVSFSGIRKISAPLLEREDLTADHDWSADGMQVRSLGDAGVLLDNQARQAYRLRLAELAVELPAAERAGDAARAAKLDAEQLAIRQELRRAFDRNGRARVAASVAERARVNVTRTVRLAIDQIVKLNPKLGRYLHVHIRTGYFCSYRPDPDVSIEWQL